MSQFAVTRKDIPEVFQTTAAVPDRLVHLIPDELAKKVPAHPLFTFPRSNKLQDGFLNVSAKSFANAINRTSWFLESILDKPCERFPTVGYMGSSDIRYFLLMFGAIKAGYKMLFLSPRNSMAGHLNVLAKADCHVFLSDRNTPVDSILRHRSMQTATLPDLEELLDDTPVPHYSYTKTFKEARMDPCLVLHTTGSTGLPKPITWKLGILSTYETWRTIPPVNGYVPTTEIYQGARRVYNSMPLYHTSGLNTGITMTLLLGLTTVYGAASIVPHAAYADEMYKWASVDASIGPPHMFEESSNNIELLGGISRLQYVLVCGAPLSQSTGDIISQHTRVISNFGATETACLPRLAPSIRDWAYFYWHPTHSGIEMREYANGLYELFLIRDPTLHLHQGIFTTFPHLQQYSMNDLYARHPDKDFLYRWVGRVDDVIVLSNGEKVAPALMEAGLMSSPLVKGAMIVGHGKFQPAALIDLGEEPPSAAQELRKLKRAILPAIRESNLQAATHAELDEYHILFADLRRPIHYLGQGKIQRHQTYQLYEEDIENLYQAAENLDEELKLNLDDGDDVRKIDLDDQPSIRKWVQGLFVETTNIYNLEGDDNFFQAGMNSLHVIRLVREMKFQSKLAESKSIAEVLSPRVVYENPSLNELSRFLCQQAGPTPDNVDSAYQSDSTDNNDTAKIDYMKTILGKHVKSLPVNRRSPSPPTSQGMTVLLTGSTGSLGSYILNGLINDSSVIHIICLDRTDNAANKYGQSVLERGLTTVDAKRVEFFKADLAKPHLGLPKDIYRRLAATVTHVIHCQWPVNFNWTLSSFEPHIAGVRNLACLASVSTHNAFVLFVSSVAAVQGWKAPGQVPEAPIHDLTAAAGTGYGQSKLIAECLLDKAAQISGVRSACCRVGIVAGPVEKKLGMWNKHEYIPSIVVSSAHLGAFPVTFPSRDHINWLPVDKLSKVIVEILSSASEFSGSRVPADEGYSDIFDDETRPHTKTFHVVNPHAISWHADFAAKLLAAYPSNNIRPVSFNEWLEILQASVDKTEQDGNIDVERNPAMRLVGFYKDASVENRKGQRALQSRAAQEASKTLRDLGPLGSDWLENWMVQWGIKPNQSSHISYEI
ncbi:putative NRPS-like enzyme [Xylariaceae sp. FL0662B]|nr:putative NRPS-like enzyme [Xylariaceae sp. FL0662B]